MRRRESLQPQPAVGMGSFAPGTIVDAPFYKSNGQRDSAHLYTYPAIVLSSDCSAGFVRLHYLSDGLCAGIPALLTCAKYILQLCRIYLSCGLYADILML